MNHADFREFGSHLIQTISTLRALVEQATAPPEDGPLNQDSRSVLLDRIEHQLTGTIAGFTKLVSNLDESMVVEEAPKPLMCPHCSTTHLRQQVGLIENQTRLEVISICDFCEQVANITTVPWNQPPNPSSSYPV